MSYKNVIFIILLSIKSFSATYNDDFSVSENPLSPPWSTVTGYVNLLSFGFYARHTANGGTDTACMIYDVTTTANQSIAGHIKDIPFSRCGFVNRFDKATKNGYAVLFGNGDYGIYKFVNGVPTMIGAQQILTIADNQFIKFTASNDTLYVHVNGSQMYYITDATYSSGYAGIMILPNTSYLGWYDAEIISIETETCDTVTSLILGSETTDIHVGGILECETQPANVYLHWTTDTTSTFDSTEIPTADSLQGDTVKYVVTGLTPSDTIYFRWRSSSWLSVWTEAFTADSIDTTAICVVPIIDSLSNDTISLGSNLTIYGLLDDSCTVTINAVEQTIVSASSDSCVILVSGDPGDYNLIYSDTCGSDTIAITITSAGSDPVSITEQPKDTTVVLNDTATFIVIAENADSYQWYMDTRDNPAVGYTSDTIRFPATSEYNGHYFFCRVIGTGGDTVWSDSGWLTVVQPFTITSVGVRVGFYIGGVIRKQIDSVYIDTSSSSTSDMAKCTLVGQSSSYFEFTPPSIIIAALGSAAKHKVVLYYEDKTYTLNLSHTKAMITANGRVDVSTGL